MRFGNGDGDGDRGFVVVLGLRVGKQITGGRAFTSYLHEEPPVGSTQYFVVHVHFGDQVSALQVFALCLGAVLLLVLFILSLQRFRSEPVPASVDPPFDSVFVIDLNVRAPASPARWVGRQGGAVVPTCVRVLCATGSRLP